MLEQILIFSSKFKKNIKFTPEKKSCRKDKHTQEQKQKKKKKESYKEADVKKEQQEENSVK